MLGWSGLMDIRGAIVGTVQELLGPGTYWRVGASHGVLRSSGQVGPLRALGLSEREGGNVQWRPGWKGAGQDPQPSLGVLSDLISVF